MKKKKLAVVCACLAVIIAAACVFSSYLIHRNVHFCPDYEKLALDGFALKETLSDEDYKTVFYQTGLGRCAVDELRQSENFAEALKEYQDAFFAPVNVKCVREAVTTSMEYTVNENGGKEKSFRLAPYKTGYVLIMESSHSFFWRHGHAGLVMPAGKTLEAPMIGSCSTEYDISQWRHFPNFVMLRLKDTDDEALRDIARSAYNDLRGIPYSPFAGIFSGNADVSPSTTQCAHLVWYAFKNAGIDVDANGGRIVTVQDILNCDKFEIVQIYGFDPARFL